MHIKQIGKLFPAFKEIQFHSKDYLLDADLLIVDLQMIANNLFDLLGRSINEDELIALQPVFDQRMEQFKTYLENGHNLFVFNCSYRIYSCDYTTESGRVIKKHFDLFNLIGLETKDFIITETKGININPLGEPITKFLRIFKTSYSNIFEKYKGTPICEIKNTKQAIGIVIPIANGNIFLLPELQLLAPPQNCQDAFVELNQNEEYKKKVASTECLPDWCNDFIIGDEADIKEKAKELKLKLEKIDQQLLQHNSTLEKYNNYKRILISTGKELENIVADILKNFGYDVKTPSGNRDDLIIKKGKDIGVIEIKGVKGSSAEKHAAQLMKWVNNYHIEYEFYPKGILIVNSFKDFPIHERKEETFPNQMLDYCIKMNFCLISTHQLLELFIQHKFHNLPFEDIHKMIFTCNGILALEILVEK